MVYTRQAFSQVGRRRRPEPVLTYEPYTTCRINDMRRTGIGSQTFKQTQLTSPTCIVISSVAFTKLFEVSLAISSAVFTNLFAVALPVLSFVFAEPCFVCLVIGSLSLPNSLPVRLPIPCSSLLLFTPRSRCK